MPCARVNGLDLYYEWNGDAGDALVLAHGWTEDSTVRPVATNEILHWWLDTHPSSEEEA